MKDHHFVCSLCMHFFYVYKVEYCKFYMFIVYYCIVAFIGSQHRSDTLALLHGFESEISKLLGTEKDKKKTVLLK